MRLRRDGASLVRSLDSARLSTRFTPPLHRSSSSTRRPGGGLTQRAHFGATDAAAAAGPTRRQRRASKGLAHMVDFEANRGHRGPAERLGKLSSGVSGFTAPMPMRLLLPGELYGLFAGRLCAYSGALWHHERFVRTDPYCLRLMHTACYWSVG